MTYPRLPPLPPVTGNPEVDEANCRSYLAAIESGRQQRERRAERSFGEVELVGLAFLFWVLF